MKLALAISPRFHIELAQGEILDALEECIKAKSRQKNWWILFMKLALATSPRFHIEAQGEIRDALEECIKAKSRQLVDPLYEIGISIITQIPY